MPSNQFIVINGSFLAQPATGVQRFAVEISKALRRLSADVEVVAPKNIIPSAAVEALSPVVIGQFTGHLWEQVDLFWYARQKKALLLNLDMRGPLLYQKKVITIHDLNFLRNPGWVSRRFYYFYRFLVAAGAKTSCRLLTVSEFSKQEIMHLLSVPSDKIEVIYNAVTEPDTVDATQEVSYPYVLSVSSTNPRKNLVRLIEGFLTLKDNNHKLVLVGLPEGKHPTVPDDGNVLFLGYVSDQRLVRLYQQASAFVYPSLYEGFGIPPLEAMQYGCPVVVANSSSLPEICGDAALYIDPTSSHSIGQGIQQMVSDHTLREKLIKRGHERIKQFSWKVSAEKLLRALDTTP